MNIDNKTTALVVTDPQNDFLSEDGAAWGLVGDSVQENNTIANLEALLTAARDGGYRTTIIQLTRNGSSVAPLRKKCMRSACLPAMAPWI
jgi:nicotinamidase-related amidase